jgi:hypothetical protein
MPKREVGARNVEDAENCLFILAGEGTARRFPLFGRTAWRKLAMVPDIVPLRGGIFKGEGYSKPSESKTVALNIRYGQTRPQVGDYMRTCSTQTTSVASSRLSGTPLIIQARQSN